MLSLLGALLFSAAAQDDAGLVPTGLDALVDGVVDTIVGESPMAGLGPEDLPDTHPPTFSPTSRPTNYDQLGAFYNDILHWTATSNVEMTLTGLTVDTFSTNATLAVREAVAHYLRVHDTRVGVTAVSAVPGTLACVGEDCPFAAGDDVGSRRRLADGEVTVTTEVWCTQSEQLLYTEKLEVLAASIEQQDHMAVLMNEWLMEHDVHAGGMDLIGIGAVAVLPPDLTAGGRSELTCPFHLEGSSTEDDGTEVATEYRGPCPAHEYCKLCECQWEAGKTTFLNTHGKDLVCGALTQSPDNSPTCNNVHCVFNGTGDHSIAIFHHIPNSGEGSQTVPTGPEGGDHNCRFNRFTNECKCVCHGEAKKLWQSYKNWFCDTTNGASPTASHLIDDYQTGNYANHTIQC
jgi:hypothetical protein